ncbi:MAG: heavy-metal-associated domain-containing protein [Candidatus Cryptobacteroides sp.]
MKLTSILSAIVLTGVAFTATEAEMAAYSSDSKETATVSQQQKNKKKTEIKEVVFNVHLHCDNCVKKIRENISFEKGVKGLEVSLEKQTVDIKYDAAKTDEATLKAAVESLGYPVKGSSEPAHEHHDGHQH